MTTHIVIIAFESKEISFYGNDTEELSKPTLLLSITV